MSRRLRPRTLASAIPLVLGALVVTVAADHGRVPDACAAGVVSRVFLGQQTRAGPVTEGQWRAFVADAVTPRFPSGFTKLKADGHWRGGDGASVEERTRIIEIAHDGSAAARERVRAMATDYRQRFAQESVLVTQAATQYCFEDGALTSAPATRPAEAVPLVN